MKRISWIAMAFTLSACIGSGDGLTEDSFQKLTDVLNPPTGKSKEVMYAKLNTAEIAVFACLSDRKSANCERLSDEEKSLAWKVITKSKMQIKMEYGKGN